MGLSFKATYGVSTVEKPPTPNIAPPGYYMLFILNKAGVPSVAMFVQVSQNPTHWPPKETIAAPAGDVTIKAGQAVTENELGLRMPEERSQRGVGMTTFRASVKSIIRAPG